MPFTHERLLPLALEATSEAIATADQHGAITFLNAAAEELTGWRIEDAFGQDFSTVFPFDAPAPGASERGAATTAAALRRADGTTRLVEHSASPIIDAAGDLLGVVLVLQDVTARRAVEVHLAITDRLVSVGQLAAGIAHEINNPLSCVTSNLAFGIGELDRLLPGAPPQMAEALLDIRAALRDAAAGAARAAEIVKDVKKFTSTALDPPAVLSVDLNRACELAARIAGNEVRHRAKLDLELQATGWVRGEEGAFTQVIVNLLTNAAHAIPNTSKSGSVAIRTWSDLDWTYAEVKDTGCGIAAADLSRIFDPFFTTKPAGQGTGLGLALCHSIVTNAGGALTCESTEGQGSKFTVRLPRVVARETSAPQIPAATPTQKPTRVLVIDDEELIGTAIRRILSRAGMEVIIEDKGQGALDRLAQGEEFDCILCDLMMPEVSGADVYDAIAARSPKLLPRVVLMTGNAFASRERDLFSQTSNVTIEKPFLPDDLKAAVAEVLRRNSSPTG